MHCIPQLRSTSGHPRESTTHVPQSRAGSQAKDRRVPSRAEQEAVWSTGPRPPCRSSTMRFPILSTIRPINPLLEVPLGLNGGWPVLPILFLFLFWWDDAGRAAEHRTSASSASHLFPATSPARKRFQQADWMPLVEAQEIAMPRSRRRVGGLDG